ncbi:hypothetical protein J4E05_16625 [Thalassospira sp. NFXS8]|uniref:hypothetical protein n=1 Tax=Thalassospira sp. NFXS8 TaxID=2819093 RepID=UPI0032DE7633
MEVLWDWDNSPGRSGSINAEVKNKQAVPGKNSSLLRIEKQALASGYEYSLGALVYFINTPINAVLGRTSTKFRFALTEDLLDYIQR